MMRYHVISICLKGCLARLSLRILSLGEFVEEGIIGSTMDAVVLASAVAQSVVATASSVLPFSERTAAIKTFHLIRVS